jgi:DnaJ-domain-containing protein 1
MRFSLYRWFQRAAVDTAANGKRGYIMQLKRIASFAIGALLLGALSACSGADTSAAPAVSKGTEQMIATAAQPATATAGQTLRESLGVPMHVDETPLQTKNNKFSVEISADVTVPVTDHLSIYRVSAAEFSQDMVERMFTKFCGDTAMYDYGNLFRTKKTIQDRIDSMQNDLDMNDSPDGLGDDAWRADYEAEIAKLKAELLTARDDLGDPIVSARLVNKETSDNGTEEVFEAVNAPKAPWNREFHVGNNVKYPAGAETSDSSDEYAAILRSEASIHYNDTSRVSSEQYKLRDVTAQPQISELATTPKEAMDQVSALLKALEIENMHPFRVCLTSDSATGDTGRYAYYVEARRTVGGVEVQSPFNRSYIGSFDGGKEWAYETLEVRLDDGGLLGFSWVSPLSVGDPEVERANLLPFSSILTVAKNMLAVVNEPLESDLETYSACTLTIDHITLSLQRISDANSIESGLLIPVWNFYGQERYQLSGGTEVQRAENEPVGLRAEPYLSINAIDGSVISKTQGF